jgi:hypothetical protein
MDAISNRYGELTSALNKQFRNTESKTANTLRVGSFGRKTGIDGISDLDMLYIMPKSKWDDYKDCNQLRLLQDTKTAILERYPKTKVKVDRLVVTVTYTDFLVEVQPVFEQEDQSYYYPDTKDGGSWKVTKPREEMLKISELDSEKNGNLKRLCKMARAWKNKHGVGMGGLLIDTLAYNFLKSTTDYDDKSYLYYDWMSRDFFKYLSELPKQDYYAAPGSGQRVKVKKNFQSKAKKAYDLCLAAIEAGEQEIVNSKWKNVYGKPFPSAKEEVAEDSVAKATQSWNVTEHFIEDQYPVDIRENLVIDCDVKQDGFRTQSLRYMLASRMPLKAKKKLRFWVKELSAKKPHAILWKVLNRGGEARHRNCIRGQIVEDKGRLERIEETSFKGDHVVECYCVMNGVVVAKDRIHVPIENNQEDHE